MQTVSEKWKEMHEQTLLPESFIEINFGEGDPVAQEDGSIPTNGAVHFANPTMVLSEVDKTVTPYATLEQNMWVLDGSMKALPTSNYGYVGYISSVVSNDKGEFTSEPIVSLDFTQVHSEMLRGITIDWGTANDEYAVNFTVTAYNGTEVVATKSVTDNNTVRTMVLCDIGNYNRITITVHKWCLPYHRVRIGEIYLGLKRTLSKKELLSFNYSQSIDPISSELPQTKVKFSVEDYANLYNPDNSNGLFEYLHKGQEMTVRFGYKVDDSVEWIDGGLFYLSEWSHKPNGNCIDLTTKDMVGYGTKLHNAKLTFDGKTTRSLYDLAEEVLIFADLPLLSDGRVRWVIDESLKDIYTTAPLPLDTMSNCLQLIANAGCCVFYQDRQGILHIEKLNRTISDYAMTSRSSFSKPESTRSELCEGISVSVYEYGKSESRTKIASLKVGYVGAGKTTADLTAYFYRQMANVEFNESTFLTVNSYTIYADRCEFNVTNDRGEGLVTVYGYGLTSESYAHYVDVGGEGEVIKVDNPLITTEEMAEAVGQWMKENLIYTERMSFDWRPDPRLDCYDIITSEDTLKDKSVMITKVQYSYDGAFRGTAEGSVI